MKITKYVPRHMQPGFPVGNLDEALNELMGWNKGGIMRSWAPDVDIAENPDSYEIHAELPGMREEDINITLNNNVLTISGEKKREIKEEKDNFVRVERSYGKFERSFSLPNNITGDRVSANYSDGVLKVTLPKAEEAKSRTIKVSK
ncbi:MAG: Hsp20/alpha crystallin family protein [Calditrichaeota bacterium]|nr:Hsp20/alpha crystallin family protein [Calditrichota bacterium]MCB9369808.1 Hsp20/alpha crystallin family protein [Calditrichota bacterium]